MEQQATAGNRGVGPAPSDVTVEVPRPPRHQGTVPAQPEQPTQELPTPLGARGNAGMVSNVLAQPVPR
eukprot:10548759-Alexandrium_andersonii.AAC.1